MVWTPLLRLAPRFLVKMEAHKPGGSHKVRAARFMVKSAMDRGQIVAGKTTVIEKTGGNFGLGLALACAEHRVPVELAVGLGFSPLKREMLRRAGATLIGLDQLQAGQTPRQVVAWHLEHEDQLGKHYFYTDQFNNSDGVLAHEIETGTEIAWQLLGSGTSAVTLVLCAGTGASLTGVVNALVKHNIAVNVVLVEPMGCDSRRGVFVDHRLEGMSVGVPPPFIDWHRIDRIEHVNHADMVCTKTWMLKTHGHLVGNTSAACLYVVQRLQAQDRHSVFLTFVYDHGLWYPD